MSGIIKLFRAGEHPYTQIPNAILRDPNISSNAVRLYAYLSSHQMGYEITYEQIQKQTDLGEYAINTARKILVDAGWLKTERPVINGRYQAVSWILLDPASGDNSTLGDSTLGNSSMEQSRNNKKNTSKEEHIKKNTFKREKFSENWSPGTELRTELETKYPNADIDFFADQMITWIISKGKESEYKDMNATLRNWLARENKRTNGSLEQKSEKRFIN